jgi:hypothetical protein
VSWHEPHGAAMSSKRKSFDPTKIVGEILGVPASLRPMIPDELEERVCPFSKMKCAKASKKTDKPICSFWERSGDQQSGYSRRLVATCPKRFYQTDFLDDIVQQFWPGVDGNRVRVLSEVTLPEFGRIDFVAVLFDENDEIEQFVPIEVQSVDITTPAPLNAAYAALYDGVDSDQSPTTGGNWDNVYKRYVTQLIRKGFVAHSWDTKIVAVIQDQFFSYMFEKYPFMTGDEGDAETNILFFTYKMSPEMPIASGEHIFSLHEIHGTNHASLQSANLYKKSPTLEEFSGALTDRFAERRRSRSNFVKRHGEEAVSRMSRFDVFTSKGN